MFTFLEVPPPSFWDTLINVSGERFVPVQQMEFPKSCLMSNNLKEKSPFQTYQSEMSSFILQWILIKLKLRGSQDSTKKNLS